MVEVTRSNFTESVHHGAAVLINSNGEILEEWGNSNLLIYPRSALKPIQSLNLYKDGVAEALNLSDNLIALTTASHHAEDIHQKMIKTVEFHGKVTIGRTRFGLRRSITIREPYYPQQNCMHRNTVKHDSILRQPDFSLLR